MLRSIKLLFLFFMFSLNVPAVSGQSPWTIFNDQNSSLPQNTVRCLTVDSQNNIWAGTDYGLARFNGISWTIYNTGNSQIPGNNIRSLATDGTGAVWIGTLSAGVARYQNNNWTVYNTTNSGLPGNFIRTIAFDHSGNIWFGGSAGLSRLDVNNNWTTWNNTNSPLISHHISTIAITEDNTLCLGTINGGMVYMKDTTYTFYNLWNGMLPDNSILSIVLDSSGNRWIGMPSGGLSVHYGAGIWQGFTTMNSSIQSDAINAVFVDNRNTVYIGSQDKGLIIRKGFDFTNYDSLNSDVPDVNVLSIVKDHDGILWLGTMYGGLVRFDESQTSVSDYNQSQFNIYPTLLYKDEPLYIESEIRGEVIFYDIKGQEVINMKIEKGTHTVATGLGRGVYFLKEKHSGLIKRFVVY